MKGKLSIIVPVLNEEKNISTLLKVIDEDMGEWFEVIVVDGGSTDHTAQVVSAFSQVLFLKSDQGRGLQMNAGAQIACGDYFLFLHADTIIEKSFLPQLKLVLRGSVAGSFKMKFNDTSRWLNFYSRFTSLNWSIFTYGDQGLLVSAAIFKSIGGYTQMPILEDIDIVRRIKKEHTFLKFNLTIKTSARRFVKNGYVLQQLKNIMIVTGYYLGLSPQILQRFYRY